MRANNDPCLECERPDCPGICDKLRNSMDVVDTSRAVHTITWHGVTRPVSEWAEILGVSRQTLYRRLNEADDAEETLNRTLRMNSDGQVLPHGCIEETYIRLSTMHLDYLIYWNRLTANDSSAGLVARYGAVQVAPTNATSNPTESRALPEASLSDEALYRRGWIATVLCVIERYHVRDRLKPYPSDRLKAQLLEWRAINGLTLKKMSDKLNEMYPDTLRNFHPAQLRKLMEPVVSDVAREALKRGLVRSAQK